MNIFFAALARDCEKQVGANLRSLLKGCRELSDIRCTIWILENDSKDQTREVILKETAGIPFVNCIFQDRFALSAQSRTQRIAACRDYLLHQIKKHEKPDQESLYVPIDLDSCIASSIQWDRFSRECKHIFVSGYDAIFPISSPYYYDIFALRAHRWSENDCWQKVKDFPIQNEAGKLIAHALYVYSRQKRVKRLQRQSLIPVSSAFGGVGIYRFDAIYNLAYHSEDFLMDIDQCEHIPFNLSVNKKAISTSFIVESPSEHISLRSKGLRGLASEIIRATQRDLVHILRNSQLCKGLK